MALRQKLFKRFALALFALFIVNSIANLFYLYQSFSWFDQVMHFSGGVIGGLFLAWFFFGRYAEYFRKQQFWKIVVINTILFILAAGLWEALEFGVQDWFGLDHVLAEVSDSINDVVMGTLGNFLAILYYYTKVRNENAHTK